MAEAILAPRPPRRLAARTARLRRRLPGVPVPTSQRELARAILQAAFTGILRTSPEAAP
jgi:hypothetical protein